MGILYSNNFRKRSLIYLLVLLQYVNYSSPTESPLHFCKDAILFNGTIKLSWQHHNLNIFWETTELANKCVGKYLIVGKNENAETFLEKSYFLKDDIDVSHSLTVGVEDLFSQKIKIRIEPYSSSLIYASYIAEEIYCPPSTPSMTVNYTYVSENEIGVAFSSIYNLETNLTSLYVLVLNNSNIILSNILENELKIKLYSKASAIITHNEAELVGNLSIEGSHERWELNLRNEHYIRIKLEANDRLKLVPINRFQNITRFSEYGIQRPHFIWTDDLLHAGGLVLLLVSPTLIYIIYRLISAHSFKKSKTEQYSESPTYGLSELTTLYENTPSIL